MNAVGKKRRKKKILKYKKKKIVTVYLKVRNPEQRERGWTCNHGFFCPTSISWVPFYDTLVTSFPLSLIFQMNAIFGARAIRRDVGSVGVFFPMLSGKGISGNP